MCRRGHNFFGPNSSWSSVFGGALLHVAQFVGLATRSTGRDPSLGLALLQPGTCIVLPSRVTRIPLRWVPTPARRLSHVLWALTLDMSCGPRLLNGRSLDALWGIDVDHMAWLRDKRESH
jgi:hypothetical protein